MADFAPDAFTLFTTFNKSKLEGKTDEYWAKSEWPIDQINALHAWANSQTSTTTNQKGEVCVTVNQKLLPRTSKAGNDYLLGITSDAKPANNSDMPF
jgi:hypothetical protein